MMTRPGQPVAASTACLSQPSTPRTTPPASASATGARIPDSTTLRTVSGVVSFNIGRPVYRNYIWVTYPYRDAVAEAAPCYGNAITAAYLRGHLRWPSRRVEVVEERRQHLAGDVGHADDAELARAGRGDAPAAVLQRRHRLLDHVGGDEREDGVDHVVAAVGEGHGDPLGVFLRPLV